MSTTPATKLRKDLGIPDTAISPFAGGISGVRPPARCSPIVFRRGDGRPPVGSTWQPDKDNRIHCANQRQTRTGALPLSDMPLRAGTSIHRIPLAFPVPKPRGTTYTRQIPRDKDVGEEEGLINVMNPAGFPILRTGDGLMWDTSFSSLTIRSLS